MIPSSVARPAYDEIGITIPKRGRPLGRPHLRYRDEVDFDIRDLFNWKRVNREHNERKSVLGQTQDLQGNGQLPAHNITTMAQPPMYHQQIATQVHYTTMGQQIRIPLQQQPLTAGVIVSPIKFGPFSQNMMCPHCGSDINTAITSESNWLTHACAIGLFLIGCFLCSCLPYCIDSVKDIYHYCPNCKASLGVFSSAPFS